MLTLRGGAFKPLSFPYRSSKYIETREDGIRWLGTAKKEAGIGIITEVMEEKYLDLVSRWRIFFRSDQEHAKLSLNYGCCQKKKPLMIKRHYGASLRDWLGAAEYALYEGNSKVILCERGVSVPHTHKDSSRFC